MKRLWYPFLCLLAAVLASGSARADDPAYDSFRILPLNVSQEFESLKVTQILQDRKGLIWLGTRDGLVRYDGYRMLPIPMPKDGNGYGNVRTLCEDNEGRIWIGSFKGICYWDPETECVSKYSEGAVARIVKARDGRLWVAANYGGFLRIDPKTFTCDTLSFDYDSPSAHYGEDVCCDDGQFVYLMNGVGAVFRAADSDRFLTTLLPFEKSPFSQVRITQIHYRDGILYGGQDDFSLLYDTETAQIKRFDGGRIHESVRTASGHTLMITSKGTYDCEGSLKTLFMNTFTPRLLLDENLSCLYKDRDGSIWAGSSKAGVFRIFPNDIQWRGYRRADDGSSFSVKRLIESPADGNWWAITEDGELLCIQKGTSLAETVSIPDGRAVGLGLQGKELLVGTTYAAAPLLRILPDGRKKVHAFAPGGTTVFLEQDDGKLWAGGWLYELDFTRRQANRIERVRTVITDLKKDKDGGCWIGTGFSGLWSVRDGIWEHWLDSLGVSTRITCLCPDSRGGIWIGSQDDGLQHLDPIRGVCRTFNEFDGIPFHHINDIAIDSTGCLWALASGKLIAFDPKRENAAFYTSEDGLPRGETELSCVRTGQDGRLWVGGHRGLQSFDPVRFRTMKTRSGRIVFTGFTVRSTRPSRSHRDFIPGIDRLSSLHLAYSENSFILGVSQADYDIPCRSRLEYRILPQDSLWRHVRDGSVTVSSLPHGTHYLQFRLLGRDGSLADAKRQLEIHVAVPPAASAPAILAYVLLLALVLFLTFRESARRARRKAQEQAFLENEKKEAESQKQLYASKVTFLTSLAHEIRTPLALVKAPIETLEEKLGHYADRSVGENLEIVSRNADKLSQLLNELLDFRRIENGSITLNPSEYDIGTLIQSVFARFKLAARLRHIEMKLQLPQTPLTASVDKNAFDNIVGNLLSNAIKYGQSHILLSLEVEDACFRVVLENDGTPVPAEKRESIFRPFERFVPEHTAITGTGIGMFVSRNLTELHGGSLRMDEDLKTNRFIATFPIRHLASEKEEESPLPDVRISNKPYSLLIVEDNEEMRSFISRQFESQFTVLTAADGLEALEQVSRNNLITPDCIISDIMMPNMDGLELCRKIKENPTTCHIPVILLTGRAEDSSKLLGLEYGADAYLVKPFSSSELITQVRNLLKNRERLKEKYSSGNLSDLSPADSPDTAFLRDLQDYVEKHISDDSLSVEVLASIACMSESNLFKKMKKLLGVGPNEYILVIRLQSSQNLLRNTALPISEIASRCGFSSPSYFASCFKSRFGITAKEYRNGLKKKA